MKILLIGKYGEGKIVGGPERVARELFYQLLEKNIDVSFAEYFFSGYKDYSLLKRIAGKKIISKNFFRLGIIQIFILILKKKYDIVHFVNIQRFQLIILLFKKLLGIKIVSTFHGITKIELKDKKSLNNRFFLDKWVESLAIRYSDLITFPSSLLFDEFRDYYKISSERSIIIPNGVTLKFINIKNQIDFSKEFNLIFYNGFNRSINKGLKKIIEQLSRLKNIKINLFIIGFTDTNYQSQNHFNIVNVGFLEPDLLIEFCKDKQFIIKSDNFDSFSLMVLESMALGIIPIITEKTGIKDYIENGINGFIYDSKDPDSLLNLFNDISMGMYDLNKISLHAKKIRERLTWDKIADSYYQSFEGLLN